MAARQFVGGVDVSATRGLDAAVLLAMGTLVETAWFPDVQAFSVWLDAWGPILAVVAVILSRNCVAGWPSAFV